MLTHGNWHGDCRWVCAGRQSLATPFTVSAFADPRRNSLLANGSQHSRPVTAPAFQAPPSPASQRRMAQAQTRAAMSNNVSMYSAANGAHDAFRLGRPKTAPAGDGRLSMGTPSFARSISPVLTTLFFLWGSVSSQVCSSIKIP